ncbi:alpha/beta fold hydrolase [Microbulbifer sp. DLAB2-AA]|uniref:alpha/beta fold hydrolase n=1 Tax=Microbulbifer sp. DLAB2-AA TaxID=3243394 RepID=UPI00403A646B
MATFVLVHGAWQGGWCWRRVADRLRNFGHLVFAPTLTGLGERVHLLNDKIDLDTHIQDVLAVIESEELSNIILCGHSYGGVVITGVADKVPSNVRTLVYLDALVPESGLCTLELLPKEIGSTLLESARSTDKGFLVAPDQAKNFGVNIHDQAWVNRRSVDQPLKTFEQPIFLEGAWKLIPDRIYIYATGWAPGIGKPFYEIAQRDSGWQSSSIQCGHDVMIDKPEELTQMLIDCI